MAGDAGSGPAEPFRHEAGDGVVDRDTLAINEPDPLGLVVLFGVGADALGDFAEQFSVAFDHGGEGPLGC